MIEDNMVTGNANADDSAAEDQGVNQTFTQQDIDRIVKERIDRERKKFAKQFEGVDVDKYRELTAKEESIRLEQEKKQGNFEKILQETVGKKDQTIQQLQQQLHSIKVDGSLLNAASSNRAVNPQQVVRLLKDQIRLGDSGDVEVLDDTGEARFNDAGKLMSVDELVGEFLTANPHFVSAGPSGSGAQGGVAKATGKNMGNIDITKLNMALESDRAIYKELMKSKSR
jgi:hypothetical protein